MNLFETFRISFRSLGANKLRAGFDDARCHHWRGSRYRIACRWTRRERGDYGAGAKYWLEFDFCCAGEFSTERCPLGGGFRDDADA